MAWPLTGHAEEAERVRRVAALLLWPKDDPMARASVTAFVQALGRFGWIEGKNIRIDYCFAASDPNLFKTYAAERVGLKPDVLLAGASLAIAASRQQTRTIPIVFVNVSDPVGQGFVESLARPAGNITGFTAYDAPLMGKWLQLLKEIAPSVTRVVVIFTPDTAPYATSLNHTMAPVFRSLRMGEPAMV
jgi:putative ABC transport system substrate-binding protein